MSEFQCVAILCGIGVIAATIKIAEWVYIGYLFEKQGKVIRAYEVEYQKLFDENKSLDDALDDSEQFVARAHMLFVNYVMQGEDCKQEAEEWVKDCLGDEESEGRDV